MKVACLRLLQMGWNECLLFGLLFSTGNQNFAWHGTVTKKFIDCSYLSCSNFQQKKFLICLRCLDKSPVCEIDCIFREIYFYFHTKPICRQLNARIEMPHDWKCTNQHKLFYKYWFDMAKFFWNKCFEGFCFLICLYFADTFLLSCWSHCTKNKREVSEVYMQLENCFFSRERCRTPCSWNSSLLTLQLSCF